MQELTLSKILQDLNPTVNFLHVQLMCTVDRSMMHNRSPNITQNVQNIQDLQKLVSLKICMKNPGNENSQKWKMASENKPQENEILLKRK